MGLELIRISLVVVFAALSAFALPKAHADIYKCTDEDGNVAYLQLPCPAKAVQKPEPADDPDSDIAEYVPPPEQLEAVTPSSRLEGELLEDCKKRFRDQIDAIDAEILSDYSPEQGKAYKEQLLALTRQLRACG